MITMVRVGEKVLIVKSSDGSVTAMDVKAAATGKKAIIIVGDDGSKIAVRCLNTYLEDEGLVVPLPCGSKAFLPSEPPDYFWNTALNESGAGMGCSCSQGAPETNGWQCAADCGFRKELGICKISLGYMQNIYDPNFCSHQIGRNYWYGNEYVKETTLNYACAHNAQYCPHFYLGWYNNKHNYCPNHVSAKATVIKDESGNIVYDNRGGACPHPEYLVVVGESRRKAYACARKIVCPYYNGGAGTVMCSYGPSSPPPFSPGVYPAGCQNPGGLSFTGWEVPGGSNSEQIQCVFNKATEGMSGDTTKASGFGDENIQCIFSVF